MTQYIIKTTKHCYGPTERVGYYVSAYEYCGDRWRARRMSRSAAEALVAELECEEYRLSHNESGAPTYTIDRA